MSISVILLPTWGVKMIHITSGFVYINDTNEALAAVTFGIGYLSSVTEGHTPN
jgi:hypothetical protein